MRAPDWLTARPVAHRGLHDRSRGIIENMPGAALAAIEGNFAIECDVQLTVDGEAMVHHDDDLGRLTEGAGALLGLTSMALKEVCFKDTTEKMMSLADLCILVRGRVPIIVEVAERSLDLRKQVDGAAPRGSGTLLDRDAAAKLALGDQLAVRAEAHLAGNKQQISAANERHVICDRIRRLVQSDAL